PAGDASSTIAPRRIPTAPTAASGPIARRFLTAPGFSWTSFATAHATIRLANGMSLDRAGELADSVEAGRRAALTGLGEGEVGGEPPIEVFLVETREDMRRLAGRPAAGSAFPNE